MGNIAVKVIRQVTGIHNAIKMKKARDKMKSARSRHKKNLDQFKEQRRKTKDAIEKLGALESDILESFEVFSDVFEMIQNRPEFKEYSKKGVKIPKYKGKKLKKAPVEDALFDGLIFAAPYLGPLVSPAVFYVAGEQLSHKAKKAHKQMKRAEKEIDKVCDHMKELRKVAVDYKDSLESVNRIYQDHLARLQNIVNDMKKTNWNEFSQSERLCVENSVLLTALLYNMCKVQLVRKEDNVDEPCKVNTIGIERSMTEAKQVLTSHDFSLHRPSTA